MAGGSVAGGSVRIKASVACSCLDLTSNWFQVQLTIDRIRRAAFSFSLAEP